MQKSPAEIPSVKEDLYGARRKRCLVPLFEQGRHRAPCSPCGLPAAKALAHPLGQLSISVCSPRWPSPRVEPRNPDLSPGHQPLQSNLHLSMRQALCSTTACTDSNRQLREQRMAQKQSSKDLLVKQPATLESPVPQPLRPGRPGDTYCPRSVPGHLFFLAIGFGLLFGD